MTITLNLSVFVKVGIFLGFVEVKFAACYNVNKSDDAFSHPFSHSFRLLSISIRKIGKHAVMQPAIIVNSDSVLMRNLFLRCRNIVIFGPETFRAGSFEKVAAVSAGVLTLTQTDIICESKGGKCHWPPFVSFH